MSVLKVYDDSSGYGECRSCHAPLTWYELTSGKRHPFDGRPVYLETELEPETHRLIGHLDASASHFATCPQSKQWSHRGSTVRRSSVG